MNRKEERTMSSMEEILELSNGDIFSFVGKQKGLYGVGFLVKEKWKENILEFRHISDRVTILKLKIGNCVTSIIQAYAPTCASSEVQLEAFYDDLDEAMSYCQTEVRIVMGDFNARLGQRCDGEENVMGPYGYGTRNDRGDRLVQWLWQQKLTACNSLFKREQQINGHGNCRMKI